MNRCVELLFAILCHCFALVLLATLTSFSLEGGAALVILLLVVISVVIGWIVGLHGFFSGRKDE